MILEKAYLKAQEFTKAHYENFPVISLFLPVNIRKHIAVVYQFARQADDIADEGSDSPERKLIKLKEYKNKFENSLQKNYSDEFWFALSDTISTKNLTAENFLKLIEAFESDVTKNRFKDFSEILSYCSLSANPVGRIILELNNISSPETLKFSDYICTALQLTNFYQDVSIDVKKNRIYIPLDEIQSFGLTEDDFLQLNYGDNFKKLIEYQVDRAQDFFNNGKPLLKELPGRLKRQINWTILGGEEILKKIRRMDYRVDDFRPKLNKIDYIILALKAIM